jgi:hypothetical protein
MVRDRNVYHVLTGIIQFVVANGRTYVSFDMICHNRMNFTKKNLKFHPTSLRVYWIGFVFLVAYNFRSLLSNEHFLYFLLLSENMNAVLIHCFQVTFCGPWPHMLILDLQKLAIYSNCNNDST